MVKNIRIAILSLLLILIALGLNAQEPSKTSIGIGLVVKHSPDSICLRWAPKTPTAWSLTNKYGWTIERVMLPNSIEKGDTAYVKLTRNPITPIPLDGWEAITEVNDQAAVAAQTLYGESIEIETSSEFESLISKRDENDMRFSFGLSAADQDFTVAQMMGLGFTDKQVTPERSYIYRIYATVPDSIAITDTAFAFVNLTEKYELPKIFDFTAQVKDTSVIFNWPSGYFSRQYSSYIIERGTDTVNFHPINNAPIVNLNPGGGDLETSSFKFSPLVEGDTLFFRIRGLSPFGELGPPSKFQKVTVPFLVSAPNNISYSELENSTIIVKWDYPKDDEYKISHFSISTAQSLNSEKNRMADILSTERSSAIKCESNEFYLWIEAIEKGSNSRTSSNAILVQLKDTIAPAPVTEIFGSIDTTGTVKLLWKKGSEIDLYGYKVFGGYNPDAEFKQVTGQFARDTFETWKIGLNTLSRYYYVKIKSYDLRYNQSEFSQTVRLQIPDTIAPTPPLITRSYIKDNKVYINWIGSGSSDVMLHTLNALGEKDSTVLDSIAEQTEGTYIWDNYSKGKYRFTVTAIDSSGNKSHSTQYFELELPDKAIANTAPKLTAKAFRSDGYIELTIEGNGNTSQTLIYKRANEEPFRLYKTLAPGELSFKDKDVAIGVGYEYVVKIQQENASSIFSNIYQIKF